LISACVGISWALKVNVQVIHKGFSSIDPFNISTLVTEEHEIRERFKQLESNLFWSIKAPSFFD